MIFYKAVQTRVQAAIAATTAQDDRAWDEARKETLAKKHRPVVCSGKPGTGKSTVVHENIKDALSKGASVLLTMPTARMVTRMRARLGEQAGLTVDTCTAGFQLHKPEQEALYCMHGYELVVVDEYSQLGKEHFERIMRAWENADKTPALVFLGDKYQLPGQAEGRPWESSAWNGSQVWHTELTEVFRCEDPDFLAMQHILRTSVPSKEQLNKILRGRKAWTGDQPSADDIGRILREHPEATIVAASREGVARINALALEALHPRAQPLVELDGTWEDNAANYDGTTAVPNPRPSSIPIHKGSRLYLTRNVRKKDDYVNGMLAWVLAWDEEKRVLWVKTETGKVLPITPWHDAEHANLVYYPIRLGYCSTIHKVQGDEFPFIIIYLDRANMPGVGYTAITRVKNGNSYLIGGHIERKHFVPVTI